MGKTVFDIQPEDIAEIYARRDSELFETTGDQIYESRIKASDGTIRDVVFQKAVIHDDSGEAAGIVGSIIDITERKKSELKLERAKESKVIDSNESFAHLMGDDIVELYETIPGLKGADATELVPEVIFKMISNIMVTGENNLERDLKHKNRLLHISVVTIYKQRVVGAVIRDMSAPVLVRDEIISRAQRVNRQNIETVQKIAYLMGENAAQTEELINSIIESYRYSDDE
jgi:hypothetical protein